MATTSQALSVSVVICAYTLDRWARLREAVASVLSQTVLPIEVVVCVDHNPELLAHSRTQWSQVADGSPPVRVIENVYPGHLGSARNSALEIVSGDIVAFLDDDAHAGSDWLESVRGTYAELPEAQAVGGAPRPVYEHPRPPWTPPEFDWVFGCAYRGLPTERTATPRLIGACMTVRRPAILAVGGFHSDNHDDLDLSHRIAHRFGPGSVIYEPAIQVSHHVTAERLTFGYFWRRCFSVNRGKVLALHDLAGAGGAAADVAFVRNTVFVGVPEHIAHRHLRQAGVALLGMGLAGAGNLIGRLLLALRLTPPSSTRGLAVSTGQYAADGGRVG